MSQTRQLCTFFLDTLYLGVDVNHVQAVLRYCEVTRVPLAPSTIGGLINLRGQIVTAVDIRPRLGLPDRSASSRPMNVVIRGDDGPVSLLVDEISDVVAVREQDFEARPGTLKNTGSELILGVYKLEERLLLLLDAVGAIKGDGSTSHRTSGKT